jgi:phospholipase C
MIKANILAMGLTAAALSTPVFAHSDVAPKTIPKLDHVFVIMMENHSYGEIFGNSNAPFINKMAEMDNLATNYFAVGHPSLTNYLEVVGGSNFGIANDNYPNWHNATPSASLNDPIASTGTDVATSASIAPFGVAIDAANFNGITIGDQLVQAHMTWKTYQESLPMNGDIDGVNYSDGIYSNLSDASIISSGYIQKLYAVKHNPFIYFAGIQANSDPRNSYNNMADFSGLNGLYADLSSGKVANFSFIAPNQCHDMHGIGNGSPLCSDDDTKLQMGDAAVKQIVSSIKASKTWKHGKNAIVVLWDENDFSSSPNQVVTIVDTNYGSHGVQSSQPYSHFSLLKTLETGFGLSCLNHACDSNVNVMSDLFSADTHGTNENRHFEH